MQLLQETFLGNETPGAELQQELLRKTGNLRKMRIDEISVYV